MSTTTPSPVTAEIVPVDVHLEGTDVRRRLEVSPATTLGELHAVLQSAMGWWDEHLHLFTTDRRHTRYWAPSWYQEDFPDWDDALDECGTTVGSLARTRLYYLYDFGDDWCHELRLRAPRRARDGGTYPALVSAHGACPPEDCGGPYGFASRSPAQLERDWGHTPATDDEVLAMGRARLDQLTATPPGHPSAPIPL